MAVESGAASAAWLEPLIKSVFSWVVLMPIAVILTGKILAKLIRFSVGTKQLFRIPLKHVVVQATGGEVVLGFAAFIVTLLLMGVIAGPGAYELVKKNYGIDPGHFNALCMLSSFVSVAVSFGIFLLGRLLHRWISLGFIANQAEYERTIERLARRTSDTHED